MPTPPTLQQQADEAAINGHLGVVVLLRAAYPQLVVSPGAFDTAAARGHYGVVKWLLEQKMGACSSKALEKAAAHGHLRVVKLLREYRKPYTSRIVSLVVSHPNPKQVIDYLLQERMCTRKSVAIASVRYGSLEIATSYFGILSAKRIIDEAAKHGRVDVLQSLVQTTRPVSPEDFIDARDLALQYDGVEVFKWLLQYHSSNCSADDMDSAAKYGSLHMVKWLHLNSTEGCTTDAIDMAAGWGKVHTMEWLYENRPEKFTHWALINACFYGHLDALVWLSRFATPEMWAMAGPELMNGAASEGYLDVVQWLHCNRREGCTSDAMDGAAKNGHFDIVRWLTKNRTEGCTRNALRQAWAGGHSDIVAWLNDNQHIIQAE